MSITLDGILASVGDQGIVTLSGESVAILLHALRYLEDRENWPDYSENPLDEVTDADWDSIEKLVGNAAYEVMSPMTIQYPKQFNIHPANVELITGTTLVRAIDSNAINQLRVEVTPNNVVGNRISWGVFIAAGRYDVEIIGQKGSNFGDVDLQVDGVTVAAGLSGYNATTLYNHFYYFDLPFATDGQHVLSLHVFQKQAASTGYRFVTDAIYGKYREAY